MTSANTATLADSPAARSRPPQEPSAATAAPPLVATTLRDEEAARASEFGRIICAFAIVGAVLSPILGDVMWLRIATTAAFAVLIVVAGWVWRVARTPDRYTRRMFRAFSSSALVAAILVIMYGGIYSSSPIVAMLGITIFGMGDDRLFAIGVCVVGIASYVVLVALDLSHVVPDQGMFEVAVSADKRGFLLGIVPVIYVVGLWNARASRRATRAAVENLDRALKLVHQREAQLDEARQQVDAAQARGLGRGGRYSGTVVGNYTLGDVIGRGGMGDVYAAIHVNGGATAAVKLLQREAVENAELVERFHREARITAALAVPNVVAVYEVGAAPGGEPYLAMELLSGHDLAWHLRQTPQMSVSELEALVAQVATGLAAAHQHGVIHRDIKPHNLFLSEKDRSTIWKILDFGISKLRDGSGTLTQQHLVGTPGYMSPEQAQGREATERSDVFSFGAVVYRGLTGRPAFRGSDPAQAMFEVVYGAPVKPSSLRTDVHRDVEHWLAVALAKQPDDRFTSITEMASQFTAALAGELAVAHRATARRLVQTQPWRMP